MVNLKNKIPVANKQANIISNSNQKPALNGENNIQPQEKNDKSNIQNNDVSSKAQNNNVPEDPNSNKLL